MQIPPRRLFSIQRRVERDLSLLVGFPCDSAGKESSCNVGYLGSTPGLERCPGEGNGYPFQYSGLENSMDYTVHGVAKSQTQLSNFHFQICQWSLRLPWLLVTVFFKINQSIILYFKREKTLNSPKGKSYMLSTLKNVSRKAADS